MRKSFNPDDSNITVLFVPDIEDGKEAPNIVRDADGWENEPPIDVLIVGAGPVGLACAIEAKRHGLAHLIVEKNCLTYSIFRCPTNVRFFSTPELLQIGEVPFLIAETKPSRQDLLNYYRGVCEHHQLRVHFDERVEAITAGAGVFIVTSARQAS